MSTLLISRYVKPLGKFSTVDPDFNIWSRIIGTVGLIVAVKTSGVNV